METKRIRRKNTMELGQTLMLIPVQFLKQRLKVGEN